MRINNNMMAINTHRQLKLNNMAGAKSIEKLSSGYRINRAGDDAAGLAISEKMRSQIRGLNQASRNAQDDISLIQTTEGALNETHAIIHRMREMAVQSANDTNTDEDREALQGEMDQLAAEVTRIANNTEFNTRKLLNGNLDDSNEEATGDLTFHIGANTDQNMKFSVKPMDAFSLELTEDIAEKEVSGELKVSDTEIAQLTGDKNDKLNGYTVEFVEGASAAGDESVAVNGNKITVTLHDDSTLTNINDKLHAATNSDADLQAAIQKLTLANPSGSGVSKGATLKGKSISLGGGTEQKNSSAAEFKDGVLQQDAIVAKGIDIQTQPKANEAIARIDSALKRVSDVRAGLGAVQNRLSHTIKNLDVSSENLQASESRIRDVDMAKEMMNFTKNNILQQASQAMLAQANQAPQGVLQLLR